MANQGYELEIIEETKNLIKAKITYTDGGKEPPNNNPIFSFCRKLIEDGYSYKTRLEIYRENEEPDVVCPKIGLSAKFAIRENEYGRTSKNGETEIQPKIIKYIPFPSDLKGWKT